MADSPETKRAQVLNTIFKGYDGPAIAIRLW